MYFLKVNIFTPFPELIYVPPALIPYTQSSMFGLGYN